MTFVTVPIVGSFSVSGSIEIEPRRIAVNGLEVASRRSHGRKKDGSIGEVTFPDASLWTLRIDDVQPDVGYMETQLAHAAFGKEATVEDENGLVLVKSQPPSRDEMIKFTTELWAFFTRNDPGTWGSSKLAEPGTHEATEMVLTSDWIIFDLATPTETFTVQTNLAVKYPEFTVDDSASRREKRRALKTFEKERDAHFQDTVLPSESLEIRSRDQRVAIGGTIRWGATRPIPLEVVLLAQNEIAIASALAALN